MTTIDGEAPVRVAFLGTSGHAERNMLPSLPYAPADLVALWDPDPTRAGHFGRRFGAARWFTDLDELLSEAEPEAVFVATDGYQDGEPANTDLVLRCLDAGCHVWSDKPIAGSTATVDRMIAARDRAGRLVAVGAKTMHSPANLKARAIVADPDFGQPTTFSARYPLRTPRPGVFSLDDPDVRSCLGHIWHPIGAALVIVGPIDHIDHLTAVGSGGSVAVARFANGAVGTFHFSVGQSKTSPLERVEVVGDGSNVVIDNGVHVTWYRRADLGPYGKTFSYLTDNATAPLTWQPEMSLGQLYNNNNFFQGYAPSMVSFVHAIRESQPLPFGTLEDARHVVAVFEMLTASAAAEGVGA